MSEPRKRPSRRTSEPPARPTTLRVPAATRAVLEELMKRTGRDFSSTVNELLEEGLRMRRIPGIVFADGPAGRRARIAGTGLDVFEVFGTYNQLGGDWDSLREVYHWLSEVQLRTALAYGTAYPEEIADRLAREAALDAEETARRHPFTSPHLSGPKR